MAEIRLITGTALNDKIEEFNKLGGMVDFKLFEPKGNLTPYHDHYEVAKNTILELANDSEIYFQNLAKKLRRSRDECFKMTVDIDKLENSGVEISLREFLGPQYDIVANKPIIRGMHYLLNSYFYYDTIEMRGNELEFYEMERDFELIDTDRMKKRFSGAFFDWHPSIGDTVYEHGKYFIDFCDLLFSDFSKLEIYTWSKDCSNYFNAGKEWSGAFFWTIYNPIKNIYIGVTASTTD